MKIEERLDELGITIPNTITPMGNYVPAVKSGSLLFTAGQTPRVEGKLQYTGKLGGELSNEEGYQASRLCVLNCLGIILQTVGSLDKIEQIVKMNGYVNSTPDFIEQTDVLNGASDLLYEIFKEKGAAARSAVGVCSLPGGAACEIELIVRVKED